MPKSGELTTQADNSGYKPGVFDSHSLVEAETLTPSGYERLTELGADRALRLTEREPIELILGRDHKINLRRGDDGIVRISMDGFKLPDPENEEDDGALLLDELKLSVGLRVKISRNGGLDEIQTGVEEDEEEDEDDNDVYLIDLPDRTVNIRGEQIDFTDVEDGFVVLSILIGRRLRDNKVVITSFDSKLGVAVPLQQLESVGQSRSEAKPDLWNDEMVGMLKNPVARAAYLRSKGSLVAAAVAYERGAEILSGEMTKEQYFALLERVLAAGKV